MPFRLNAKKLFLTYPNCNLMPIEALNLLEQIFTPTLSMTSSLCCRETLQSGEFHLHAAIILNRRCNYNSPNCLDIGSFHGNYTPARDWPAAVNYIFKCYKDNIENARQQGLLVDRRGNISEKGREKKTFTDENVFRAIEESKTSDEALNTLFVESPAMLSRNFNNLTTFAKWVRPPLAPTHNVVHTNFVVPAPMQQWVDTYLRTFVKGREARVPSLILFGGSQLGKSTWARSLGRHSYQHGMINPKNFDPQADYTIVDDVPLKFFTCWKEVIGCQSNWTIRCAYQRYTQITDGVPCIYIMSHDPWFKLDQIKGSDLQEVQDYWKKNTITYHLEVDLRPTGGSIPNNQ
jgi:hypothetical protein